MDSQRQAALNLVPQTIAELYRFVPLSHDGEVLRIAVAECAEYAYVDDLRQFLSVARVDVELWPAERIPVALVESYPASPSPPPAPAARFAAARELFDDVLTIGSMVVYHMVARLVQSRCPLATAEGYRCLCGRFVVVGFDPSGRSFTVHCSSDRHAFAHFACVRPPPWWQKRVTYDWMCGGPPIHVAPT